MKIVTHPIQDNLILTNKKPDKYNRETVLLGAEMVTVGVDSGETIIITDAETGYKYEAKKIEGQEVYNLRAQKHHNFFCLDLETGQRGWYPGKEE